jgi:hypothetical protein
MAGPAAAEDGGRGVESPDGLVDDGSCGRPTSTPCLLLRSRVGAGAPPRPFYREFRPAMAERKELQGPAMGWCSEIQQGALWPDHGRTGLRGASSRARRKVVLSSAALRRTQR